jgi:hypothetical protein
MFTDFVCLYNYEFWLSLCKIVRSSVILLLTLFAYNIPEFEFRGSISYTVKLSNNERQNTSTVIYN